MRRLTIFEQKMKILRRDLASFSRSAVSTSTARPGLGCSDKREFAQYDERRPWRSLSALDMPIEYDDIFNNFILRIVNAIFQGIRIEVKVISDTTLNAESRRVLLSELSKEKENQWI